MRDLDDAGARDRELGERAAIEVDDAAGAVRAAVGDDAGGRRAGGDRVTVTDGALRASSWWAHSPGLYAYQTGRAVPASLAGAVGRGGVVVVVGGGRGRGGASPAPSPGRVGGVAVRSSTAGRGRGRRRRGSVARRPHGGGRRGRTGGGAGSGDVGGVESRRRLPRSPVRPLPSVRGMLSITEDRQRQHRQPDGEEQATSRDDVRLPHLIFVGLQSSVLLLAVFGMAEAVVKRRGTLRAS